MKVKLNILEICQIIVLLILFGIKLIPQLQYVYTGMSWSIAYQGLFLGWLLLTILKSGLWFKCLKSYLINWVFWIVLLVLEFVFFPNTQFGFLSLNLTFWEPMFVYYYYSKINKKSNITRIISIACILFLLFGLFQSIQSVNINELAAREASSGHSSEDAVLTGNYSFTATLSILLPVAFLVLQSKIKIIYKALSVLFIATTAFFVFRCNLMISILCMLVTIPLYLLFSDRKRIDKKRVIIFTIVVIAFLMSYTVLKPFLIWIIELMGNLIGSEEISKKVLQLTALVNGTMVGNIASRFELDLIALRTFLHNPIIGIGPQNNANLYFLTKLGFHATLFDDMARYGIIGMSVMISVYYIFIKDLLVKVDGTLSCKAIKASYFTYLIISMLNPTISANIAIALFFIVPSLSVELSDNKYISRGINNEKTHIFN